MTDTLVRAEKTSLLAADVYAALAIAWAQYGEAPSRPQLLTVLAQAWLETGAGASSYGYNLGGIKHVPGDGHDYYQVSTHEVIGGVDKILVQPFRSYPSLAAAATDFLALVRRVAGPALARAIPDVREYAHELKARGYYTSAENDYAAALQSRYKQVDAQVPPETAPETPVAIARVQPGPGTDDDDQPTPPDDLPPVDGAA